MGGQVDHQVRGAAALQDWTSDPALQDQRAAEQGVSDPDLQVQVLSGHLRSDQDTSENQRVKTITPGV